MFKALATTLQEGRIAFSASRHLPTRSLYTSRLCYSESPNPSPPTESISGAAPAEEKPKKQKKSPKTPRKSILQESKLLQELSRPEHSKHTITVDDVEKYRKRGAEWDPVPSSPRYPKLYKEVSQPLEKAFSKSQLYEIVKLYGEVNPPAGRTKRFYASMVLAKWGWPHPDTVSRVPVKKALTLKPSEFFLATTYHKDALGPWFRDGKLKADGLKGPMVLVAQGPRQLVDEIVTYIRRVQKDISTSRFTVPIDASFTTLQLQALSRACGTFIEKVDGSEVSISYLSSARETLKKSERAILSTAYENGFVNPPPLYYNQNSATSGEEQLFSVLPFAPVPTHPRPGRDVPTYRIQHVDTSMSDEGTEHRKEEGYLTSLKDLDASSFDLYRWLHSLKSAKNTTLTVEASPGHVVVEPNETKLFTTISPLPGSMELGSVMDWIRAKKDCRHSFRPFVPKSVYDSDTTSSLSSQRLTYSEASSPQLSGTHAPPSRSVFRCWLSIKEPSEQDPEVPPIEALYLAMQDSPAQLVMKCESGTVSEIDVMTPERDADIRFTASSMARLPTEQLPLDLQEYARQVRDVYEKGLLEGALETVVPGGVSPPLTVYHEGKRFVLTGMESVRRNSKAVSTEAEGEFEVVAETLVGVENTNRGLTTCQIACESDLTEDQWNRFLKLCEWSTRTVDPKRLPMFGEARFSL